MKHLRQKHLVKRVLSFLVITCLLSTSFLPQIGFSATISAPQIILSRTDLGQDPVTITIIPSAPGIESEYSFDETNWTSYDRPFEVTLDYTIYARNANGIGNTASMLIPIDKTPPVSGSPDNDLQPAILINDDSPTTSNLIVTLTISAQDSQSGVSEMRISNTREGLDTTPWEPYTTNKEWSLAEGSSGERKVFIQFIDNCGNANDTAYYALIQLLASSSVTSDIITEDNTPEEIINNQNIEDLITSIDEIISSINSADIPDESINTVLIIIPDVALNINGASDAEQQEALIEKFAEALDSVSNAYSKHTTLENASTISKIINKLGSSGISAEKIRAKTQELYKELINSVDKLIENSEDNTILLTTVKDIISNTPPLIQTDMPGTIGMNNNSIQNAHSSSNSSNSSISSSSINQSASYGIKSLDDINNIVKKTVERLGELNLQSTSEGTNAFIDINNDVFEKIQKTTAALSDSVTDLENTLKGNGLESDKINKTITLKIQVSQNADNIITNLSNKIMNEIGKSGIKSLDLKAGLANIRMGTNSINAKETDKISLQIKKLDKTRDLKPGQLTLPGMNNIYEFKASLIDQSGNNNKIRTVNKPFVIEIPYTLKEGENPDNLSVYVYVEDEDHLENLNDKTKLNTWQAVGGKYDPNKKVIRFTRSSFSMYSIVQVNRSFGDLLKYNWAKKEIEAMASKGIITGRSSTKFDPSANITRAEFAGLIVRALGILDSKAKVSFEDVKPENWYYSVVASAYKSGIIQGKSSSKFEPNSPITRQEMMQITSNALVKVIETEATGNVNDLNKFADNGSIASWAKKAVALNIKLGIVKGNANRTLSPNNKTIRAEAAVIVKRLYDLI